MPHVLGDMRGFLDRATAWSVLERHTELFVCFGGIPLKNTMVTPGGASRHPTRDHLRAAKARGARVRAGEPAARRPARVRRRRVAPGRPGDRRGRDARPRLHARRRGAARPRVPRALLRRLRALRGVPAGGRGRGPEDARVGRAALRDRRGDDPRARAAHGHEADARQRELVAPARRARRAAAVDGGDARGDARPDRPAGRRLRPGLRVARRTSAAPPLHVRPPALPQGENPVRAFIPVARDGRHAAPPGRDATTSTASGCVYPTIRLVYWCGGNPFHHHQDLGRLRRALARPDTLVVHDAFWTPMARHADVVLPATMTLERNDIGGSPNDSALIAMRRAVAPYAEARNDHDIFADLATALGFGPRFTEGRDETAWLRFLYEGWREKVAHRGGAALPPFDEFWATGLVEVPDADADVVLLRGVPGRPGARAARHAERAHRDRLGHHRRVRLRRLPRAPDLARADRVARRAPGRALPPPPRREQPDDAAPQPARRRGVQPVGQGPGARADPPPPRRTRPAAGSGAGTSCGCSTTGGAAWPAPS